MSVSMRVLLGAAVLAVAVPGAALSQTGERSIFASVVDSRGMPVTTLDAGDFVVREDGVNRTVIRVSRAEGPQRVALLVDTSQAMRPHLLDLRQALRTFVRASYGRREVALYEFGERPNKLVDYTQDLARLEAGVGRLFPRSGSGAYVLDAIAEVARELRQKETGHTAIVVVTAEGPEFSERYHQTVLGDLYKTRASLHSLVLTRALAAPLDNAAREREMTLIRGARETGGRQSNLLTSLALDDELRELAAELNNQYEIVYFRPGAPGAPGRVSVGLTREGLTVRAPKNPALP